MLNYFLDWDKTFNSETKGSEKEIFLKKNKILKHN